MNRTLSFSLILLLVATLVLGACGSTPAPTEAPVAAATEAPVEEAPEVEEMAPEGATPPVGYEGKTWADIAAEADGQTVNWYMWGGSDAINEWVNGYVADNMQELYGVELNMVPVGDATEFINKVLNEKQAGKDTDGTVDLMWINGENFRTMRQGDLLYGPWSLYMPSTVYVNWDDASVANDFGFPVEGYESPYGKAQVVMIYDSAKVPEPPATIDELVDWIKANPGKFTYPAPPDFTGSVFVRHICYWAAGGHEKFLGDFDQAVFDTEMAACWEALNELEPYLWREGQTYPENATRLEDLFANSEVYFDVAYNPANASNLITQGKYPETTRTFVFDEGTIANTHYVAIPYNSPNKAGAMALANFLLSPEAQLSKAHPDVWGDLPAIDPNLLPEEYQQQFSDLPRGIATLPMDVLAAHRLPELQSPWLTAIEQGWEQYVLRDEPIPEGGAEPAPDEPAAAEGMPPGYEGKTWDDILAEADGQTVKWWQWGGSDVINRWITGWVADQMKEKYNVTVELVPVTDATEFVNKVLGEKEAGRNEGGAVDLMWINGENFRTMKQADLLYGPWAYYTPSAEYYDWDDLTIKYDQGFPVEGYEMPYARTQFVIVYNSAKVPEPPKTIPSWWNGSRPTPASSPTPPDFTGTANVRHFFYHYGGGVDQFMGDFDEELYLEKSPPAWEVLNEIEPYLWREGETYPENLAQLQDMFANSEVDLIMYFSPASASLLIEQGRFPETTRTAVFDTGTEVSTNYVAISYNSPDKAGAMVLADFLASPEAVYQRALPDVWGTMPTVDMNSIPVEFRDKLQEIPRGVATLPADVLAEHAIPQVQSTWRVRLEKDWVENVLQK